jgi:hypothetical protein
MLAFLLVSPLAAAGCLSTPLQKSPEHDKAPTSVSDPFPMPSAGISITIAPREEMKLDKLLDEFARVTGQNLLITRETRAVVQSTPTGLFKTVEVPPQEVYPFVESILVQNDFALFVLSDREPRMLAVWSLTQGQSRASPRNSAVYVPVKDIASYARHPAILVTTMIDLPNTDVRTLSNSMRTMFTDANTQQIIPVGNSNSLIITGFGSSVANLVAMLRDCDEMARRDAAEVEKQRRATEGQRTTPAPTTQPAAKEEKPK